MSNDQWNNGQNSQWQQQGDGGWGQPQQSANEWAPPQGQPQQSANEWAAPTGQRSAAEWDPQRHDNSAADWSQRQTGAGEWQQGQSANEWSQQQGQQVQQEWGQGQGWGQPPQGGWEPAQNWGQQQGGWEQQHQPTQDWEAAGYVQQGHGSRAVKGLNPFSPNFTEFSLPRSAGIIYVVGIVAILAIWLSEVIWSLTDVGGGGFWVAESLIVGLLRSALAILVLRVILEGVIALIKIAQRKPE
ncbi:DUF4282 domain-containing protein [Tessaracoccus oleiagri]|uniref:DUF4282 domain-containing protein n=1 Tax=Tessaracoccus oleiagri TaxID=686624 RepID=A0A1G9HI99_9ACTN|nr:DUF4282 domain-containing protein [Tessaracoccus oleiagri]SDL12466.1 protein of unknown function [Tessaracoccus oleiagri]